MTTTKIDVLGFLDPAIRDQHSGEVVGHDADIAEARAAVAELLEAASAGSDQTTSGGASYLRFDRHATKRLRAALARIQPL